MGCGGHCSCSCGTDKAKGSNQGPSRFGAAIIGVLVLAVGVVGIAAAFQPEQKESPKTPPAAPAHTPAGEPEKKTTPPTTPSESDRYVLNHTMKRIDGTEESLKKYEGQVVLIVNVASKCGNTPQYAGLQKLYTDKKDAGLVVLGFPANNFLGQEPCSNKEISEFCTSKYSVTFPMFEKISVKGDDAHELYKKLAAQAAPIGGEPQWNFTKFIVDRSGKVVARFEPKVAPDAPEVLAKIDELLKSQ